MMQNSEHIDVVIIGAGQAGISMSYFLQQQGVPHIVLERDRAFSSWHNRWDGFRTNTPNWMNTLPVLNTGQVPSNDPKAFATREEIVAYFEDCLTAVDPPIRTNVNVERIVQLEGGRWQVHTQDCIYETPNVVICTGAMSTPRIPQAAASIPESVPQMHSRDYQNPAQLETKSVLIVGSASSGVQICRLLCESGRFEQIHLAVSKVMVLPEHILGIQTHRFLHFLGLFDVRNNSLLGKVMYSGLETKGDPIIPPTPEDFSRQYGVKLYGKFAGVEGTHLRFDDGQTLATDDLSVLWCTGFRGEYTLIEPLHRNAVFDDNGYPRHDRGVSPGAAGLYFVGLRFQHTVASHDIYGVGNDAQYVAKQILQHMPNRAAGI